MSKFRTPLKSVRGLGSAKTGTEHFVHQRLTAAALVALGIWFLVFVLGLLGSDYATAAAAVAKPWNAVPLIGLLIAMFWHAQLGMQVVLAHLLAAPQRPQEDSARIVVEVPERPDRLIDEALEDHLKRSLAATFPPGRPGSAQGCARALLALRELAQTQIGVRSDPGRG